MLPHLRCKLLDHIKTYSFALIKYLREVWDYNDPVQTSKLLKKVRWTNRDISFLMNCSMIYRMAVICDERSEGNLKRTMADTFRLVMMHKYCRFEMASRTLLAFCTYSALGGRHGIARVQVPMFQD